MYVCFDIGDTAIKSAVLTLPLELKEYAIFESKNDRTYLLDLLVKRVHMMEENYVIEGICLSIPGAVESKSGTIYGVSALSCIHGFSWKEALGKRLPYPIRLENDANCVALCELAFGKGKEHQDFLSLVIGTGVGASIVKHHQIHHGATLLGGEFGFMILNRTNTSYETFSELASVGSLVKKVRKKMQDDCLSGKDIIDKADKGHVICKEAVDEFYRNVAVGIYNMWFVHDLEMIVISGAVSQRKEFVQRIYEQHNSIMEDVIAHTFHVQMDYTPFLPHIVTSAFSKDANIYGAFAHHLYERGLL